MNKELFNQNMAQYGFGDTEIDQIYQSVSAVADELKMTDENRTGVLTAFVQIAACQVVRESDIRSIGQYVPGSYNVAAGVLRVSVGDFLRRLGQNTVKLLDFLPALAKAFKNMYCSNK